MIDLIAGIVTYNPDIEQLKKELSALKDLGIPIVLVDNNSFNIDEVKKEIEHNTLGITLICNQQNLGIAKAHNQILGLAKTKNIPWALTLDQDSKIPQNLVEGYRKAIGEKVGIVGPKVDYLDSHEKLVCEETTSFGIVECDWLIASASLINVNAWEKIGGFDEKMFIDLVDRDFCIRIKNAGFKILRVEEVRLQHHLGNTEQRTFLGHTFTITNHNTMRKYYKARNYIYLWKKKELSFGYSMGHELQMLLEIIVFEDSKATKIKSVIKGIMDGIIL